MSLLRTEKTLLRTFVALLALSWAATAVAQTTVDGVRLWAGPEYTRVVLDLSGPVDHRLFTLAGPDRVVIDVPNATFSGAIPSGSGLVRQMRSGVREGDDLRLVIDLAGQAHPRSFLTEPNQQYGHRLVIDLEPVDRQVAGPVVAVPAEARDLIIAIDAGHGGEDPGASGRSGAHEKTITLALARALAREVDAIPGMRSFMVRDGDYFLRLETRRERARAAGADLFISLHADAFSDPRARGAHVFVLSQNGATSEMARILAERENSADHIGGVALADTDNVLATVLLDLAQTAAISASLDLGESVLGGLGGVTRLHKRTVQQASFVVLKSPDIPSILIETGYITNPEEEANLRSPQFQQRMAAAVAAGVQSYFWQNAPPGTLIAQRRANGEIDQTYVVSSGDTLSTIADRHRVTLASLRSVNRLSGDTIRIGQQLTIPGSPR
jgi:N-acetylmuramoyl-L-alanine amidase